MSKHAQVHAMIVAAGFVPGHSTGQVQYYVRGLDKVQLFHDGQWKRTPDRVEVVTGPSIQIPGIPARKDRWTQFSVTDQSIGLLKAALGLKDEQPKPNPFLAEPTAEELEVLAPL